MPRTMRTPSNWVEQAVWKMGGQTQAALILQTSGANVHRLMKIGRMTTETEKARQMAVTAAKRTGIPLLNLLGFGAPFVSEGDALERTAAAGGRMPTRST